MPDDKGPGKEKKERVIHTRIPESLDEELRKRANRLGVSVSNLVRNALSHAFGLVEDIISDGASVARSARGDAPLPRDAPLPPRTPDADADADVGPAAAPAEPAVVEVVAWQRIILNEDGRSCARCNTALTRGADAALGLAADGTRLIVCIDDMNEELSR